MAFVPTSESQALLTPALTDDEVLRIRNDFPVLSRPMGGHPLIYLDSGATSQNPLSVIEAEQEFYEQRNAAVHRGAHLLAVEATDSFEDARETLAAFLGAGADEIIWTSNATEGLNLLSYAFLNSSLPGAAAPAARFALGAGDEIVVTEMEHHANLIPWQQLAERTGATLRFIPVDDAGAAGPRSCRRHHQPGHQGPRLQPRLQCPGHHQPGQEACGDGPPGGALTVLDACQSAPHLPLDVRDLGVDFAVLSGHKMLGPTGIGVLYGRSELLNALPPFLTGGSMITTVTMERAAFLPAPQRFEAGTQKVSQAIALAAAANYLTETGMDRVHAWESLLGQRLVDGLASIPGVRVLGPAPGQERIGLASFDVAGVHAHDVGQFLDSKGIAVRVGHHCAQPLHRRLGLTASTRASTYLYNTTSDVDAFLAAVAEVRAYFGA